MNAVKEKLMQSVDARTDELFAIACDIFDHPEYGRTEVYASGLLTRYLEEKGFTVERGLADLPTSFRATWERGTGGPSIGFLLEYDSLKTMGHACGHHLQGPNAIAAALALRDAWQGDFKLVLYGTPDEEIAGGKIDMVNAGCFQDVDVMFGTHTAGNTSVACGNKALAPTWVTFHGTPAHAAGSPWKGRSAMDAMLLCFHGLEVMREHVKDGCRIHYTIKEGTGPSNIVHEKASAHITLRSTDRLYMEGEMVPRMHDIVKGACMMTGTTAEITPRPVYWNYVSVDSLRSIVLDTAEEIGAPKVDRTPVIGGGSTDIGNVSWVVPTVNLYIYYSDHPGHTNPYMAEGKSQKAKESLNWAAKTVGITAVKLLNDPALLKAIQEEHKTAIQPKD